MEISDLKLKEKTTDLINLFNQRKFEEVADLTKKLIKQYPYSVILWNLLGAASKGFEIKDIQDKYFLFIYYLKE